MNPEPRFTKEAVKDLDDIWDYIAEDDPIAADGFIDQLYSVCERLAFSPLVGRQREEFRRDLRSFPHGNYLIFYIPRGTTVEIIRIIHGNRDLKSAFDN
jgi:toxin ParE1/3/4